ncbi:hypothetical protein TNIN_251321 [Trichonephila inaurata madagascariensis]|uniref:Uncharacterized protein n=1 Tax=Trichonephila inaurata madagascariensis TaxID=2747483 RepID=A0A8X6MER5_9ARAC|nr:hypothetical protein TNIN_251321 [Trichonephila inaurata madagascariensis]
MEVGENNCIKLDVLLQVVTLPYCANSNDGSPCNIRHHITTNTVFCTTDVSSSSQHSEMSKVSIAAITFTSNICIYKSSLNGRHGHPNDKAFFYIQIVFFLY